MIVFIPRKRDVWIILTAAQHRRQALGELVLEKPELVGTHLPSRFGFFIFDIMPRMVASFISLVSLCFVCLCTLLHRAGKCIQHNFSLSVVVV